MAANVQTQILMDSGPRTVLKVVGQFSAACTGNQVILQSNTLYGANTSKCCLLSIYKLYYHVSLGGRVSLEWVGSSNSTILTFGGQSGGTFLECDMTNAAAAPTGDLNINLQNMQANDVFDFVITLNKEEQLFGANAGAWANVNAGY